MLKQAKPRIEESSSPLFQEGFFVGVKAQEDKTYNCKTCLTILKERQYNPNSPAFIDFVQGWKFSLE